MFSLNTTLLREKFIIRENREALAAPMIALGNRIALPLITPNGTVEDTMIVRAQNMHSALRLAAMLCDHFYKDGPLTKRQPAFDYAAHWQAVEPQFEQLHNKNKWVAIYHQGKCIFSQGEPHPFFSIIENCDAKNRDEYDKAVELAEMTFNQSGKNVVINHHTNIAAVIGSSESKIRLGLILRRPGHAATFNFTLDGAQQNKTFTTQDIAPALNHAANWLELIQLSVTTGFHQGKRGDAIARSAPLPVVQARLGELNIALTEYEKLYAPHYRPDRPDMMGLIADTKFYAKHGQ